MPPLPRADCFGLQGVFLITLTLSQMLQHFLISAQVEMRETESGLILYLYIVLYVVAINSLLNGNIQNLFFERDRG